mmetsp:Transcript_71672/g.171168  ORF Transcript_71672/g.171168 Transcript_71672/m.171168 type:complete len:272 (+) Transcript_71672:256-1071(+)
MLGMVTSISGIHLACSLSHLLHQLLSSLMVNDLPSFKTPAMPTTSPRDLCGTAKAMQSFNASFPRMASSTSKGEIFSPARLMISLKRPQRYMKPSESIQPLSPVLSQPSPKASTLGFASMCSRNSYPLVTGPFFTTTSPSSPTGRKEQSGWPFMIRMSGPACMPTERSLRLPYRGLEAIGIDSVIAYVGMTETLSTSSMAHATVGSRAAEQFRISSSLFSGGLPFSFATSSANCKICKCIVGTAEYQLGSGCETNASWNLCTWKIPGKHTT